MTSKFNAMVRADKLSMFDLTQENTFQKWWNPSKNHYSSKTLFVSKNSISNKKLLKRWEFWDSYSELIQKSFKILIRILIIDNT